MRFRAILTGLLFPGEVRLRRGATARLMRLRLAALKAFQPFLNPILAYFLGSPGLGIARVGLALGIKVGQLLTCYLLLIRVALVAGFNPLFTSIDKILVNLAAAGMRSNVGNHITPAQTGHVRLCSVQSLHTWRKRFSSFIE